MTFAWSTVGAVEVNRVRLGYRETGDPDGTPVVLLHGSGSSAGTWDGFAAKLSRTGYRAIAVDLRGHGSSARARDYSPASVGDDLVGLLEAFDLRDAVLVGHSIGAYASLQAARQAPDRIAQLVLEDLSAPPRIAASLNGFSPLQVVAGVAAILLSRRDYHLRAVGTILRQLSRPDPQWWARLGEVRHPTLMLSGGPSSCIPPERLAEVAAAVPGARLETIPVGHRVHSLAPERFADVVLGFLASYSTIRLRPAA
jgi:3-oxoadipate enol-lactonase